MKTSVALKISGLATVYDKGVFKRKTHPEFLTFIQLNVFKIIKVLHLSEQTFT